MADTMVESIRWIEKAYPETPDEAGERLVVFERPRGPHYGQWLDRNGRQIRWASKREVMAEKARMSDDPYGV